MFRYKIIVSSDAKPGYRRNTELATLQVAVVKCFTVANAHN